MNEETYIYHHQLEPICVAFSNPAWSNAAEDEVEQRASKALQAELEVEYGLSIGSTSVGTGAAEPGFLILIPSAVIGGAFWLFFKGKEIQPNIDAWKALFGRYLRKFFVRDPSFDRGGGAVLALLALSDDLEKSPKSVRLISYRKGSTRMDDVDIAPAEPGQIDDRARIEAATVHVYLIEANDRTYTILVHGHEVTVK